jgi:hypothetical protein
MDLKKRCALKQKRRLSAPFGYAILSILITWVIIDRSFSCF